MTGKTLLIGVDVGGTNTDSVLIDPQQLGKTTEGILSWNKAVTTANVSEGIYNGISKLLSETNVNRSNIASVTIGTTHFINAIIEKDSSRLAKVAILRLCGPYSKNIPPFSDFPLGLRNILEGYVGFLKGGYHVDGNEIQPLDEDEIIMHAHEITSRGIKAIVVTGVFSPLKDTQELKVKEILENYIPGAKVVLSHTVSGIGFIERENASILNASIISFAEKIIHSFMTAVFKLGLNCPILLTQNDGTVLPANEALNLPIKTFSSGTTNSMRGASFLSNVHGKSAIVIDVGGTSADVGLLLPSGFPRQSSSYCDVGGVKMNFSMPHVESIGLGGGSIVRLFGDKVTIGPDSVGSDLLKRAKVCGGDTLTATDVAISQDDLNAPKIGDPTNLTSVYLTTKKMFNSEVKSMLEKIVDKVKTNPEDIPVLAVGGGSFIVPENLKGASAVIRPSYYNVANAIGAAMGKVSSEVHSIKYLPPTDGISKENYLDQLKIQAIEKAISKGALRSSIKIVFESYDPIPYVDNTFEFFIKTIAEVDYSKLKTSEGASYSLHYDEKDLSTIKNSQADYTDVDIDYMNYIPEINSKREWILSETDLEFLRIGTYILGCGGGGNPYSRFLETRNLLRDGHIVKIIDINDIRKYTKGEGAIVAGGSAGSPTVSNEQLSGDEMVKSYEFMTKFIGKNPELVFPFEIGGGNGLAVFPISSSAKLSIPVVDCDLMGRAYPTHCQTLQTVYSDDNSVFVPTVFSNGNGNTMIIADSKSDFLLEKVMRASLSEIGATVDVINPPMTADEVDLKTVHGSLSLAWRIGRAVRIGRQKSETSRMPEIILKSFGDTGSLLFTGKIVGVERKLFKGHVWGELILQEDEDFEGDRMIIPFKNENIYAKVIKNNDEKIVCSVPDLISVIDSNSGEAVGTPDYRYGLFVFVLGIAPSNNWTDTPKGLEIGGPKAFGLSEVEYNPIGVYSKPISVVEEFSRV